jgi:hypothetical protein
MDPSEVGWTERTSLGHYDFVSRDIQSYLL